ncbi:hypothetical protein [Kitasatospora sp. NPDC101183]|uniref:hypothetical protein n=1 Tax=Kitasatospora sp. NPDC101183 TaxID=3364100 RepID=UPI00381E0A79
MFVDITLNPPRAQLLFVAVLVLGTVLVLSGRLPAETLWAGLAAPLARLATGGRARSRSARGGRAAR